MLFHTKPNSPPIIYLDQMKWIDLARAFHQRPDGVRFTAVLQKMQGAVQHRTARFPLSSVHVIETMKMGDLGRRQRLAHVMANISEGWTISPPDQINADELTMAIPKVLLKPVAITRPLVFGRGIEFAFGQPPHDPSLRAAFDSPDEVKRKAAIYLFETMLQSPNESLRKRGIDRYNSNMNTLAAQAEQVRNLVKTHSKNLQQRAFAARFIYELFLDRPEELIMILTPLRVSLDEFFTGLGKDGFTQLIADMPTADVELALRQQQNAQYQKAIAPNDLNDRSFLSAAIPYCDVVVTERQWVDLAKRRKFDQKYHTRLMSDLTELEEYL